MDILLVIPFKGFMELLEESEKGMDRSKWKGMTTPISMTFKCEEEKYANKFFTMNFMIFIEMKKITNMLG